MKNNQPDNKSTSGYSVASFVQMLLRPEIRMIVVGIIASLTFSLVAFNSALSGISKIETQSTELLSVQDKNQKLLDRIAFLESIILTQSTQNLNERIQQNEDLLSDTEENLTELNTRMDFILDATKDENVQTVINGLQRFKQMEEEIDVLDDRLWTMAVGGGIAGLLFLIKYLFFPSRD